MTMEELLKRESFLKRSLETYYINIDHMDNVCTIDPSKFKKLKAYNEKRLKETKDFIQKKEKEDGIKMNRAYATCTTV